MHAGRVVRSRCPGKTGRQWVRDKTNRNRLDYKTDIEQLWLAVRNMTGKNKNAGAATETTGIAAEQLNQHHAAISTDPAYQQPSKCCIRKACVKSSWPPAFNRYTGLDKLPACFIRLGAPVVFAKPLANRCLWETALSHTNGSEQEHDLYPLPKVTTHSTHHTSCQDLWLTYSSNYPSNGMVGSFRIKLHIPTDTTFAFQPAGFTTAAMITLLGHITQTLFTNPYVIVTAIDFTKRLILFDTQHLWKRWLEHAQKFQNWL